MLNTEQRRAAAKALAEAERTREPIAPLVDLYPDIEVEAITVYERMQAVMEIHEAAETADQDATSVT